jgi:hypothetical protein
MHQVKKWLIICSIVVFVTVQSIGAESSAFIGVLGDYLFSNDPLDTTSGEFKVRGNIDYRSLLGSLGYLKMTAYGEASYNLTASNLSDYIAAKMDSMWYLDANELDLALGAEFSFSGIDDTAPYWSPDWELTYRINRGRRLLNPYVSYRGYATSTQLFNGIQLGIAHAPQVEFEYSVAVEGGIDTYRDAAQTDLLASIIFKMNGLSGYTLSWQVQSSATYRWSADNTREGILGTISAQTIITPSRLLQFQISPAWHWEYLTTSEQWNLELEISTRADVAIFEHIYGYIAPSAVFSQLQDSEGPLWDVRLTAGVDIGLGSW